MASMMKASSSVGFASQRPSLSTRQLPSRPHQLRPARVSQVTQDTFEADVLKSDKPVVVDFWATWCGPCKLVSPLMDWAEKEYNGAIKVVKVEHGSSPLLIEQFKVYGLPAIVLMKDGKMVPGSKREGAFTKAILTKWLADNGVPLPSA